MAKKNKGTQVAEKTIKVITKEYKLNGSVYILADTTERKISQEQYENMLGARGLMENLGGKERYYKGYNLKGELVVNKIISTSPDKDLKTYRYFVF